MPDPFSRRNTAAGFILLSILLTATRLTAADVVQLYVSPSGSDDGPDAGWSENRPFRTLARSAQAVQQLVQEGRTRSGIVVNVLPGIYRLSEPLVLDHSHSGTAAGPVVFRTTVKGEVQVLGSVAIDHWEPAGQGIFQAAFPEQAEVIRRVYAAGRLLPMARTPNVDLQHPRTGGMFYAVDGVKETPRTALIYDPDRLDPGRWGDFSSAGLVIWPNLNLNCDRLPLQSVDTEHRLLRFASARYPIRRGNRFYVEGIKEELDAPGEWYADRTTRRLLLIPPGESIETAAISIPVASGLLVLEGDEDNRLEYIRVEGFRFGECTGSAVVLRNAHNCRIATCEITRTGDAGIVLLDGSSDNRIEGCDVAWTGSEGLRLEGRRDSTRTRPDAIACNLIENNHIHHIGTGHNAGGGIDLRPYCGGNITHDNVFRHNLIHDTPRKGLMLGGVRNVAELNEIHHTNLEQSDTGSIGLCTRDLDERGCIIRHNLVYAPGGYNMLEPGKWAFPSYCWAVYLDDWTSGAEVVGNILLDAPRGGVHIHGGLDNRIEGNIIRGGREWQVELNPITPREKDGRRLSMSGNRILRNIAVGVSGTYWLAGSGKWLEGIAECDHNLLWFGGDEPSCSTRRKKDIDWPAWQTLGFDRNSVVADPGLPPDRPQRFPDTREARELGISSIPVAEIGLQDSPNRFSWPVRTDWPREEPVLECVVPFPPGQNRTVAIRKRPGEITIDGKIGSDEWQQAAVLILEKNHRDEPAQPRSLGWVCYDADALYIAVDNVINPNRPLSLGTAWGRDDAVEVAVRPSPATEKEAILVLRGFANGQLTGSPDGGMAAEIVAERVSACSFHAVLVSPLRWTAEIRIPWHAVSGSGTVPRALQFNLTCRKTADNLFLCWNPTGRHSYGVGEEGVLRLE